MNEKVFKRTVLWCCLILIFGYAGYQGRYVLTGPHLSVSSPKGGAVFSEQLIRVSGNVRNTAHLIINGVAVFPDQTGTFSYTLLIGPGHTIIEIRAEDKFGRTDIKTLDVWFAGTTTPARMPPATTTEET